MVFRGGPLENQLTIQKLKTNHGFQDEPGFWVKFGSGSFLGYCLGFSNPQDFQTWFSYRVQHKPQKHLKLWHFCGFPREPFRKPIGNPKTQDESRFSRRTGFLSQVRFLFRRLRSKDYVFRRTPLLEPIHAEREGRCRLLVFFCIDSKHVLS